jgi:hypothetical protein
MRRRPAARPRCLTARKLNNARLLIEDATALRSTTDTWPAAGAAHPGDSVRLRPVAPRGNPLLFVTETNHVWPRETGRHRGVRGIRLQPDLVRLQPDLLRLRTLCRGRARGQGDHRGSPYTLDICTRRTWDPASAGFGAASAGFAAASEPMPGGERAGRATTGGRPTRSISARGVRGIRLQPDLLRLQSRIWSDAGERPMSDRPRGSPRRTPQPRGWRPTHPPARWDPVLVLSRAVFQAQKRIQ